MYGGGIEDHRRDTTEDHTHIDINRSTLQLAQDIPQKYFTAISYEGKCRFFRANLIGLKADRDKKEIGTKFSIRILIF